MFIDSHSHLNFSDYDKDREKVIKRSLEGNTWMINVGTNYLSSKKAVEISKKNRGVFASVGLHPINLDTGLIKVKSQTFVPSSGRGNVKTKNSEDFLERVFDYHRYGELILEGQQKVLAVGEIGLDYWTKLKTKKKQEEFKEKQRKLFRKEASLAKEFELPLILHCRLAYNDLIEELSKIKNQAGGVLHCFCGKWEDARKFLELGYYLGVNGIIFKLKIDNIIKKIPLERMLVETDCPFLAPPKAKKKRNEPSNVKYVAEKIAKIKKIKIKEVEKVTTENAMSLFKIGNLL